MAAAAAICLLAFSSGSQYSSCQSCQLEVALLAAWVVALLAAWEVALLAAWACFWSLGLLHMG